MTAIGRTTATRLAVGDRILVEVYGVDNRLIPTTKKLTGKNGVVVATIQAIETTLSRGGYSRSQTLRTFVTDQGSTHPVGPSQTFALAPPAPVVEEGHPLDAWTAAGEKAHAELDAALVGANTDPSIPTNAERVVEAAIRVADLLVNSCGFGLAEHFTCSEADTVAELILAVGDTEGAAAFLADHAEGDDEGDEHYTGEVSDEPIDAPTEQDRHAHLPSCANCGEKVYNVEGHVVTASGHDALCPAEGAPTYDGETFHVYPSSAN